MGGGHLHEARKLRHFETTQKILNFQLLSGINTGGHPGIPPPPRNSASIMLIHVISYYTVTFYLPETVSEVVN